MGVPGLWNLLRPAGQLRSLPEVAVTEGFVANAGGQRAYRLGIDASLWMYHASESSVDGGHNPCLRMLFFRCVRLMKSPILPIFVFDGPGRPKFKRGKMINGGDHWLSKPFKELLSTLSLQWMLAPGEAEAELAYLNSLGVLDAIWTDDGDAFIFGAKLVIRSPSSTLAGNAGHRLTNSTGMHDGNHTMTYSAQDIVENAEIGLTRGGLILIALLCGGDYDESGVEGCGAKIALQLARGGYGDSLFRAALDCTPTQLEAFADTWRQELRDELRTNARRLLRRKQPAIAARIPDAFPKLEIVHAYARPLTSGTAGLGPPPGLYVNRSSDIDVARVTRFCRDRFGWSYDMLDRFRESLWPAIILQDVLRSSLVQDMAITQLPQLTHSSLAASCIPSRLGVPRVIAESPKAPQSSSAPSLHQSPIYSTTQSTLSRNGLITPAAAACSRRLVLNILDSRQHASVDTMLEFSVEVSPVFLVRSAEMALKGSVINSHGGRGRTTRLDKNTTDAPKEPGRLMRLWLPACMVQHAEPEMAEEFFRRVQKKTAVAVKESLAARGLPAKRPTRISEFINVKKASLSSHAKQSHLPATPPGRSNAPTGVEITQHALQSVTSGTASPLKPSSTQLRSNVDMSDVISISSGSDSASEASISGRKRLRTPAKRASARKRVRASSIISISSNPAPCDKGPSPVS